MKTRIVFCTLTLLMAVLEHARAGDLNVLGNVNIGSNLTAQSLTLGGVTVSNDIATASLTNGLASTNFVISKGYTTASVTNGLATTTYVGAQGYVTTTVTNGLPTTAVTNGLATLGFVTGQGYVMSSVTNGLASITSLNSITNGLATTNYVATLGYITASVTNALATTNYVASQGYVTATITNGLGLSGVVTGSLTVANTLTVSNSTTLAGVVVINAIISPPALTGNVNDWAPSGLSTATVIQVNLGGSARTITGIDASAAGAVPGRILMIMNSSGNTLTLNQENASSAANNRLHIKSGNMALTVGDLVTFIYIGSRWTHLD